MEPPNEPWCEKPLDEYAMRSIGPHIGRYRTIARELGFSEGEIDNIEEDHSRNHEEQGVQMLNKWLRREGSRATLGRLVSAARTAGRGDVAHLLRKYATEQM